MTSPDAHARPARSTLAVALGLVAGIAITWIAMSRPTSAQAPGNGEAMESLVLQGNLDIQLMMDPRSGAPSTDWNGLLRRVERITLVDEWVIVQDSRGGATGRLIIPREQIVWMNIGQR